MFSTTPEEVAMFVVSVALSAYGAAAAATVAVREVPRFVRWYRRAVQM
jgi:hypothetical protein